MVSPLTPENTKSWLRVALEVTDKATSVTLLLILIIGSLCAYYLLRELGRTRTINYELWQRVITAEKQAVDMAWRCYRGEDPPGREGP